MAGIKSFRISDETKERLELLSASIGGNKDRVFNTLMDTYSLEQEKATVAASDQKKNVETFEQYANTLVRLYLEALRAVSSSDDRIRGEFHNQLEENAKTIKELRSQRDRMVNELTLEKTNAQKEAAEFQAKNKELTAAIERLEKSLAAANEQIDAKQAMNEVLLSQVKQIEKEKEEYNQMAARFHELEKQLEELRKTISEKEKAAYEAEFLKKEEIHKAEETIRKEKDEEISVLQKQLFDMQTRQFSDQTALQEAKTALLSLRLELSQAHQKELNEVRMEKDKKIEALQNELLKAFDKK